MYRLIIKHKNLEISNKKLSLLECRSIDGDGVVWVVNAFKKYIGLDINSYKLSEFRYSSDNIVLYIRTEDLAELRNNKLNSILKGENF